MLAALVRLLLRYRLLARHLYRRRALSRLPPDLANGDILSIQITPDQGTFGIVKILVLEDKGVHIRVFTERYASRPEHIDTEQLSLSQSLFRQGFAPGHLALTRTMLGAWRPVRIGHEPVKEPELDGYRSWKVAHGRYEGAA